MTFLHSIFLNQEDCEQELPQRIRVNIDSLITSNQGVDHRLYTNPVLREFIEKYFDSDVLRAYDDLVPLAYKADLGRYCILYESGGLYSDLSIFHFGSFVNVQRINKLHIFRDAASGAPWIVSNSIIAAPPRMKIFENCVTKICRHVRERYYGAHALCPTGPHLLGAETANSTDLQDIVCGETTRLPSQRGIHNFAYTTKDGEFFAINYKRGPGLQSLGAKTNDNYSVLYAQRKIYRGGVDLNAGFEKIDYEINKEKAVEVLLDFSNSFFRFIPGFRRPSFYVLWDLGWVCGDCSIEDA